MTSEQLAQMFHEIREQMEPYYQQGEVPYQKLLAVCTEVLQKYSTKESEDDRLAENALG